MQIFNTLSLLLALTPASAAAGALRQARAVNRTSTALIVARHSALRGLEDPAAEGEGDFQTPAEIAKKWDGMDEVLQILFTIACRSKHQKDVHGLTSHKLKNEELKTTKAANDFKAGIQSQNVVDLKAACGNIVASQSKTCRSGCAARWNEMMGKRNQCDDDCVTAYATFEKRCITKAEDLQTVYKMELQAMQSQQRCLSQHCEEFPTTYTMKDEAAQTKEVEDQCKKRCTPEKLEVRCQNKFSLQADMVDAQSASACADESDNKGCLSEKTTEANTKRDSCKSDKEATCGEQHTECMGKGPEGQVKDMCDSRKKMCTEQVTAGCADDFKGALDKAKKECEASGSEAYVKCKEEKMDAAEKEATQKCKTEKTETCPADCAKKCDVTKMNSCLDQFKTDPKDDPTQFFCEKMWNFLHETSEVDPSTGNPIVFIQSY